jgi:arylsulfatase A-like enzyme/tetratricopeptide (TPR) repeat protein
MPTRPSGRLLRWQATAILTLFFFAVAGAAAIGWWYARESPPHQGPIVLISVDGMPAADVARPPELLAVDGTTGPASVGLQMPGIEALAGDAVVFERAYTHSPLMLPAQASLLSGRLPFEHGVRDDAGFTLDANARTLAELLRNRGFKTGAAVSTFLLRRNTGIAQGFTSFFERAPETVPSDFFLQPLATRPPYLLPDAGVVDRLETALESESERAGAAAIDEAERWASTQEGQRYFLFLEIGAAHAEEAVFRLSQLLARQHLYDQATIILAGARGRGGLLAALDEETLRVPLLIKQPHRESAGKRIAVPVQNIDLVPTILDLVRAPIPNDLKGRSLKPLLTDEDGRIVPQPIYAESLAAYLRFGGHPTFALTVNDSRYIRGVSEEIVQIEAAPPASAADGRDPGNSVVPAVDVTPTPDAVAPLRATLDRFLARHTVAPPTPTADAERDLLALEGYLPGLRPLPGAVDVRLDDVAVQRTLWQAHLRAARLVGQRRLPAAIHVLQRIVREQPGLAAVHYQIGLLSASMGRTDQAIAAFETAASLRPDSPEIPRALAASLMADGRPADAQVQAELAASLAQSFGADVLSSAHQVAARIALAREDRDLALTHADAAQAAKPSVPMRSFVEGRLLVDTGAYEEAARLLQEAAAMLHQHEAALEGLHTALGDALARLERPLDAEAAYVEELRMFPHSLAAYSGLATLAYAAKDEERAAAVVKELLASTPTPEGFAAAVRVWTELGENGRADALRSDARARFRGDPSLAIVLARDRPR